MPLQQKENRNLPSRKQPFRINTLTNDVSEVLRAINSNVAWKNCSGKLTKTVGKTSNPRNPKKNHMTEDDIDKLFEHGQNEKDNSRRDARQHPKDGIHEVYFGMEKMEVLLQSQLLKEENKRKLMDKSFEKQQEA